MEAIKIKNNANVSYTITAEDLIEVIELAIEKALEASREVEKRELPKYVHGLQGIADLFNVTKVTAQKYKNTWLASAVKQNGKTLLTDTEMALKLFNENWKGRYESK